MENLMQDEQINQDINQTSAADQSGSILANSLPTEHTNIRQNSSDQIRDPGSTLTIIGILVGIFMAGIGIGLIIGSIICYIAYKKSKDAGFKNTVALIFAWIYAVLISVAGLLALAVSGLDF
jgi:hypothetical protein